MQRSRSQMHLSAVFAKKCVFLQKNFRLATAKKCLHRFKQLPYHTQTYPWWWCPYQTVFDSWPLKVVQTHCLRYGISQEWKIETVITRAPGKIFVLNLQDKYTRSKSLICTNDLDLLPRSRSQEHRDRKNTDTIISKALQNRAIQFVLFERVLLVTVPPQISFPLINYKGSYDDTKFNNMAVSNDTSLRVAHV